MSDRREIMARAMLDAIQKRLEEAHQREDYDSIRVDLLAIVRYIERQLAVIESYPAESQPDER